MIYSTLNWLISIQEILKPSNAPTDEPVSNGKVRLSMILLRMMWISIRLLQSVAYAEIFMGGGWFKVIWWLFVFGVRCLWRHNLTSFPCFQTNVLAKFVDIVCIFFYIQSPYYICRCIEYELSALQVRLSWKNKLNATKQQFITAKITGCALKQGNETHSSLRQTNLQLQNQAALRSL